MGCCGRVVAYGKGFHYGLPVVTGGGGFFGRGMSRMKGGGGGGGVGIMVKTGMFCSS